MNIDEDIRIEKNSNGVETYIFDPYNPLNNVITDSEIKTLLSTYGINANIYSIGSTDEDFFDCLTEFLQARTDIS